MLNANYLSNGEMLEETINAIEFFSGQNKLATIEDYHEYLQESQKENIIPIREGSMEEVYQKFSDVLAKITNGDYSAEEEARKLARQYCLDSSIIDRTVIEFYQTEYNRTLGEERWEDDYDDLGEPYDDELAQEISDSFFIANL